MIDVKLEDFEAHRANLKRYASGLLRTRGFGNHKQGELNELAKDIVQNAYISFQTSRLDVFVTKLHFENFLKLCLYRCYLNEMNARNKNAQWTLFKKGEFDQLDVNSVFSNNLSTEQFDVIRRFKEELSVKQNIIVDELLAGYSPIEISVKQGVSRQAIHDNILKIRKKYENQK
jgi:DNA-directed RNA polymerase specialized sigma24 family protein